MSSEERKIIKAFRRYRNGERAGNNKARTWMVLDPETEEWVGAKQIWGLYRNQKCGEFNTSDAISGLRDFNVAPVGPHGIYLNSYFEDAAAGRVNPPSGNEKPKKRSRTVSVTDRDPFVASYARARAKGRCEACYLPAPFLDNHGSPFLEVHHIEHLRAGGADTPANTVALCPNCHRRAHYSSDAISFTKKLKLIRSGA